MTFVEKYKLNSIIDVLIHGYGFKCHYFNFKKLCYHYYANVHPMVIILFIYLFNFSGKLN